MKSLISCILLIFALRLGAQPVDPVSLPPVFQHSIPLELAGGLKTVEISRRCNGCERLRDIDFYSLTEPVRKERVSVADGYRAMDACA